MKHIPLIIVLICIAALAVAVVYFSPSVAAQPLPPEETPVTATELAAIHAELTQIRGELASINVCLSAVLQPDGKPVFGASDDDGEKLNINTATAQELELLPRIGPVLAAAIVAARTEHGPFATVNHLQQISGIGPSTIEEINDLVTVTVGE